MIPVLEIGGTHVSGALVDPSSWTVVFSTRLSVDSDGSAEALLDRFGEAAAAVSTPSGAVWGVAVPDPFDYERGIGNFAGVAKFGSLDGVDVGAGLRARLGSPVVFLNDADAFVLGEWTDGALRGASRCAGITLGTGVGSGWLVDGVPTDPGVPAGGRIHTEKVGGTPLEDLVSRRAVRRAFALAGGDPTADVREICASAREGDAIASAVIEAAFGALGAVVGRCVTGFGADALVVGGSMAASWDVLGPPLLAAAGAVPSVAVAVDSDRAPLVGTAAFAARVG